MNKFIITLSLFLFTLPVFADPVADTMSISTKELSCPSDDDYNRCAGINHDLHNEFVAYMKKKDASHAIQVWNKMSNSLDGSENQGLENYLANPLTGTYAPEGVSPMPERIIAKKAYKGGILYLGTNSIQDADFSFYYVGFMRYKADKEGGNIYFYNNQIAPQESSQYKKYLQIYGPRDYGTFEKDLTKSFYKGKFGNSSVNTIYQKMIRAIR